MGIPLRLLIVEDSEDDAELLVIELRRAGYDPIVRRVDTAEAMERAMKEQEWDIVVSDYVMPHFSGPDALALLRERGIDLPFIVVSGKIGESVAVDAMRAGAHDYIMKDSLARLVPAIERELSDATVRRERKQMEEQLLRAQRMEMAGRIAGQVAHDFNNLLSPMLGYPQLIKRRLPENHAVHKYCDALMKNVRQMAAINDDLLTLGRRGRFHQEPTDLNLLVEQAVALMPEPKDTLQLELQLDRDLPLVNGTPAQLQRVVSNLISNAREAMGDSGRLTLKTCSVRQATPFGRFNRIGPGHYSCLEVGDTGTGIPPQIADRIFDPFFSTKRTDQHQGSGLGLSIVQAIVGDHHGFVDLESALGKGTTFRIYLPVQSDQVDGDTRG